MKPVAFKSLLVGPKELSIEYNSVTMACQTQPYKSNLVKVDATLLGEMVRSCDRCGSEVNSVLDEKIEFLLSDGIFEGQEENYDTIETLNSMVDCEEIIKSEMELIKSDYFHCENCI
jgi:uncharacterized metal-binding protein YceD (DUF177 family)